MRISTFRPYYIASAFAIISSLSPAIVTLISVPVSVLQSFLAVIIVLITYKLRLIRVRHMMPIILVIIVFSIQQALRGGSFFSLQLSIIKFIILPIIVYYSYLLSDYYRVSLLDTFYPYFFLNLTIVYYRAFFDYTFFGIVTVDGMKQFADSYEVGELLWRPSNLSSAIVFSVEVVIFFGLQYFTKGLTKRLMYLGLFSVIPLIVMRSRSSWVILAVLIVYALVNRGKYFLLLAITTISVYIFWKFDFLSGVIEILTMNEVSFVSRFNSITDSVSIFFDSSLNKIFFGYSTGYSNFILPGYNSFNFYVENFHLSLLFDQGILVFLLWIFYNIYSILIFSFNKIHTSILLISVLITNSFSSSLTVFTLQMFYILIIVVGFNWKKIISLNACA